MRSIVKGNLTGIGALFLWATLVGLIKTVAEEFGVAAGTAMIYTIGAITGFILHGIPKISLISKAYLYGAGSLFVIYEIVFSQAIAMSVSTQQTLEVGMLNYLWPCLIVLLSMWINRIKLTWFVWPGIILTIGGTYLCVAANSDLNFISFIDNFKSVPYPYILGLAAGVTWALYSNLSVRCSKGANCIPLFFAIIAVILWVRFFASGESLHFPGFWPLCQLVFLGIILSFSYVMWEKGIHRGNFIFLAICSYFSPAASMLFASLWLNVFPSYEYWVGGGLVVGGSLLCWFSNYKGSVN